MLDGLAVDKRYERAVLIPYCDIIAVLAAELLLIRLLETGFAHHAVGGVKPVQLRPAFIEALDLVDAVLLVHRGIAYVAQGVRHETAEGIHAGGAVVLYDAGALYSVNLFTHFGGELVLLELGENEVLELCRTKLFFDLLPVYRYHGAYAVKKSGDIFYGIEIGVDSVEIDGLRDYLAVGQDIAPAGVGLGDADGAAPCHLGEYERGGPCDAPTAAVEPQVHGEVVGKLARELGRVGGGIGYLTLGTAC